MNQSERTELIRSKSFEELLRAKKRFVIPITIFFISFYFALPILTSYLPHVMNISVYGNISIAWLFAFAQFIMTLLLSLLYLLKARQFDRIVEEIKRTADEQGEKVEL